jgi:peptidoglycan glycosyltransferase
VNANIRRLAIVFAVIFGLISVDLVYWQVIDAGSLNANGTNPRAIIAASHVLRGRFYDRNGVLLVGRRVYPGGFVQPLYKDPSLAQTIGYHSLRYGDSGLQAVLNSYLVGTTGTSWTQTYNNWLHRPVHGDNAYLTIDERVQQAAVNAIQQSLAANGLSPDTPAAAIALDPRTGQVLAMVSKPYYDATCLDSPDLSREQSCLSSIEASSGALFNRVTHGVYPPGSTFKTVTLSAAIDTGISSLSDVYSGARATGPLTVDGYTLPPATNNLPPGVTTATLMQAFMWSDNVVFAQVGLKLGKTRFMQYIHRFRLGRRIPFDLPVSVSGVRAPGERFDPVALATSAFGQARVHVTPMQMALIASTIADHGRMPRPYLVKAIRTPGRSGGAVMFRDYPGTIGHAINSGTAAQVRHAMLEVVSGFYGSGYRAAIPGIAVAGKTGTAQTGTPTLDTWFISFAPADNPRIAVAVVVEGGIEGAFTAAPIARQITQSALRYGE